MKPPPEEFVAFKVPRNLLAALLMAERDMLEVKTNQNRQEFIHLSRALLSAMEVAAEKDAAR